MAEMLALFNIGGPELLVILFIFLPIVLLVTALLQCLSAQFRDPKVKIIWAFMILLLPLLGPSLWFVVGKGQIERE